MNAQQLKNSILQEAIMGRLVPQYPNDEPASVLLDKIREEKKRLVKEGKLKKKDLEETPISEDERPFEIPDSWEWVRLVDIGIAETGTTPSKSHPEYFGSFIPFLGPANMLNGQIISETQGLSEIGVNYGRIVPKGSILQVCIGGSIGKCAIVDKPVTFNQQINSITPLVCVIGFIYHVLQSDYFRLAIKDKSTGTATPIINRGNWEQIAIPLPPLAEQKRIVAKIEELLPKVEEYGKAQEALDKLNEELPEKLKKSILQEAIMGKLVPQDSNDEPASVLLNRIREEKKRLVKEGKLKKKDLEETPINEDEIPFEIPDSWEWVRLGEISTYANTKKKINAAQAKTNLWGLDLEDIEKGGRLLCLKSVGERKAIGDKTCFSEGDILYSKLRPYLLKILIAPKDGICTPEIIPFTCYGCICKEYIVYLLKSAYVDDYINSVTFGIKMPRVSTETMVSLVIPLPPLAEQKRIVAKIEEVFKEIDKLKV